MKKKVKKLNRVDLLLKKWYKILGWKNPPTTVVEDIKPPKKKQGKGKSKHVQRLLDKADSKTYPWHKWFNSFPKSVNQKRSSPNKIELADQNKVEELQSYVDKVISALGHKDALVTDESYVSDFLSIIHHEPLRSKLRAKELKKASKKLKMKINENELIIDVAKRLKNERSK